MLDRWFGLSAAGTTVRTEVLAGCTTFLTMAYIAFVNPSILKDAGMDFGAVFVATCLAAAFGSAIMGLFANYPVALAPGMGLNAYFAYGVVLGMGYTWQVALGAVFLSGLLFILISVLPVRALIIDAIPRSLKFGIGAGIGLFLAIIAMKNAGLVVAHPETLVTLGDLRSPAVLLAAFGFAAIVALEHRRVPGGVIIGVLGTTAVGVALGVSPFQGIASMPPSLAPTFLQLDIAGAAQIGIVGIVFAFLFVDVFDNVGTLVGIGRKAGMLTPEGKLTRPGAAFLADSGAAVFGALVGTSTTTSYIESAAGINVGGRTGLTALTVALLFLACLFFAPLAGTVPAYATAPALLYVACLMLGVLAEVEWNDLTEAAPATVAAVAMPFTFSIAHGIALSFIVYSAIKLFVGRWQEVHPVVAILSVLFAVKFALL